MALRDMSTGEMLTLSTTWVKSGHPDREALCAIAAVAPLVPMIESAHAGIIAAQPRAVVVETAARIGDELARTDARHDDLVRGVYWMLTGAAALAKQPAVRASYLGLRDRLFPDGLSATQKSYREEAGQALLVKARLDGEARSLLSKIRFGGSTVGEYVGEWTATAARIGELEEERARLHGGPTAADLVAARNQWIRVVNAVVATLDLVGTDAARAIRDRVRAAARAAERRAPAPVPMESPPVNVVAEAPAPQVDTTAVP